MKTAAESRVQSKKEANVEMGHILNEIEKSIDYGITKGNTTTNFYGRINGDTQKELVKLGYSVEDNTTQRDGIIFIISW